ncbi:MAG: phosphatidate cytidylyltransferase [Rhizobiales bacterium]|nr:phosphatidate cytidylyltransferase [Hyphomicrobiales bacterium]MBN9010233.1 phosphatidate cytidylyltransferase [Hyphomicrobiales bacterium]
MGSDLAVRIASAAVLAAVALAGAWFGGIVAGLVLALFSAIVYLEWSGITGTARAVPPLVMPVAIAATTIAAGLGHWEIALGIALAALVLAAVASRTAWQPLGVVYALAFGLSILALRLSPDFGLVAILFLFAVVWATDTGAYFVGRLIGGPKLWPAVSPKKTWSGAIGGLVAALVAGGAAAALAGIAVTPALVAVALTLSVASQAGDLAESALKRLFGVKDSGNIIPGHGGLMDRVDGLIFAGVAAAAIGWSHGGGARLAEGLLAW